jgi:uncharacterized protein (TIGR02266 family)
MTQNAGGTPKKTEENQRKHLRSPLIVLRVKLDDGRKTLFGYAKNISRGGLFITSVNPKEPGSRFQVEITFPPPIKRTIQCNCEVVWKRLYSKKSDLEPGMGIRFLDLPDEVAAEIEDWVKSQEV